ncbi:unnamed protein product [Leuciscus chuanchicus]
MSTLPSSSHRPNTGKCVRAAGRRAAGCLLTSAKEEIMHRPKETLFQQSVSPAFLLPVSLVHVIFIELGGGFRTAGSDDLDQAGMVTEILRGCWLIRLSISKDKGQHNANDRTLSDLTQSQTCIESDSVFVTSAQQLSCKHRQSIPMSGKAETGEQGEPDCRDLSSAQKKIRWDRGNGVANNEFGKS